MSGVVHEHPNLSHIQDKICSRNTAFLFLLILTFIHKSTKMFYTHVNMIIAALCAVCVHVDSTVDHETHLDKKKAQLDVVFLDKSAYGRIFKFKSF